jgi:hypothetical protein
VKFITLMRIVLSFFVCSQVFMMSTGPLQVGLVLGLRTKGECFRCEGEPRCQPTFSTTKLNQLRLSAPAA